MLAEDLGSVFSAIIEAMFSSELLREEDAASLANEAAAGSVLTASIEYREGFHGTLSATFDRRLARALTGRMMKKPVEECSDDDVSDAIGEIANIAAGNLKGLLPAPCQVSLPRVQEGPPSVRDDCRQLARAKFSLFGEPLWAELCGELWPLTSDL